MDASMDIYLNMFLEETKEQIEQIEQCLLLLENYEFDQETINSIFRIAHSLKGAAATMEFNNMSGLSHQIENLLDKVRSGEISIDSDVIDICLRSVDILKVIHEKIYNENNDNINIQSILDEIQNIINAKLENDINVDHSKQNINVFNKELVDIDISGDELKLTEDEKKLCSTVDSDLNVYKILVQLNNQTKMISVKAFLIANNLMVMGDIILTDPSEYEDIADDNFGNIFKIILATDKNEEAIYKNINSISEIRKIYINKVISGQKNYDLLGNMKIINSEDTKKYEELTTIRIDISKIDKLLNMVGEFIIDKGNLNQIALDLKRKYKNDSNINKLTKLIPHIDYITSELQETVMSARMFPLEKIFNRFPRMVRDLSRKCKKKVDFIIEGKETEIDRGMIEELIDPLTHIIRNCIDHGIETEDVRKLKGKSEVATIKLSAKHAENSVFITISDDGRGIDIEQVKSKLIEKGMVSKEELKGLARDEVLGYIFEPGFSTAEKITDISGRGVGLDVVRANVSKIRGIIDIVTEADKGTKFIIKLPLTLAIVHALLINEESYIFGLPISSVIEVIRLKGDEIRQNIRIAKNVEIFNWREQIIPVIRIGKYFNIENSLNNSDKVFVVIVGLGEKKAALVAQRLLGEQEIVIKSLGEYKGKDKLLGEIKGISGVSILGNGSFAQIIDIASLIKR